MTRLFRLLLASVLLVILTACSSDESLVYEEPFTSMGPIFQALDLHPDDLERADTMAMEAEWARMVADCMTNAGYDYPSPTPLPTPDPAKLALAADPVSYAHKHGYHQSESFEQQWNSLFSKPTAMPDLPSAPGVCDDLEYPVTAQSPILMAFQSEFSVPWAEYNDRYRTDARIVAMEQGWTQCMEKAGFSSASGDPDVDRDVLRMQLGDEYAALFNRLLDTASQVGIAQPFSLEPMDVDEIHDVLLVNAPTLAGELEELRRREIATAVADHECSAGPTIATEVSGEYLQQLVDENRDAIEDFVERYNAKN